MLKVTIELLPGGDPTRRRNLGIMTIANKSDLAPISDYDVAGSEGHNPFSGARAWTAEASVEAHDRSRSVWALVAAAAQALADADHVEW
ncbi:MAG: hypothetical protein CFE29_08865 [Bradyrhizobiaceae bacterium PARB1]|jgi:hypothetical protein|uniref:hypothetical protein n=1 Tax=Tardiphaga sp. TaxID=1926292 RepID=UPI000BD4DF30|nr:MAG: hypothetical protein CFE29_08865 [Bradyrhizobiaceae bacterium PARB1]